MKTKSSTYMRLKYFLWEIWINEKNKNFGVTKKILVTFFGWIFIWGEPDETFLKKYYEAFNEEQDK